MYLHISKQVLKALQVRSRMFLHCTRISMARNSLFTALKYSAFNLELLRDYEMLLMFEKEIQGGITHKVHRYLKVNNKCKGYLYSPMEESSFLQYLDCSKLYESAVTQELPTNSFKRIQALRSLLLKI